MRRLLSPFRRLAWKLTLTYTLVTVAALMAAELIVVVLLVRSVSDTLPGLAVQVVTQEVAPQARPFLEVAPPDRQGLGRWLQAVTVNGVKTSLDSDSVVSLRRDRRTSGTQRKDRQRPRE